MKTGLLTCIVRGAVVSLSVAALPANADLLRAEPSGFNEVPSALFSPAAANFHATINQEETEIQYRLTYSGFTTPVAQAHLHFGKRAVNGGIMVFLCTNLGNGPTGTPACPEVEGTVEGTLTATGVVGPEAQGIAPGEFAKVVAAIRAGAAYANIHTQTFPAGELRGQVRADGIGGRPAGD